MRKATYTSQLKRLRDKRRSAGQVRYTAGISGWSLSLLQQSFIGMLDEASSQI